MNKIENSKIILILSVLLVLLVMGSVSASDDKLVNETISTPNNNDDNIGVDIQTTTESSGSNDEQVLTAENTPNNIVGSDNTNEKLTEIGQCAFDGCLKSTEILLPKSLKILHQHAFTYSPDTIYHLNKNLEYLNGINVGNEKVCLNILVSLNENEKDAVFAGTNLEKVELGTLKSLEQLIADGMSFKRANELAKILKEER